MSDDEMPVGREEAQKMALDLARVILRAGRQLLQLDLMLAGAPAETLAKVMALPGSAIEILADGAGGLKCAATVVAPDGTWRSEIRVLCRGTAN